MKIFPLDLITKIFFILLFIYSEILELSSLTEPIQIKHEFAGSELFQYFDYFYEFGSIELNSKKHIYSVRSS